MTPQVFISYSHKDEDEKWKNRIEAHLRVLAREGLLSVWEDRQIQGGQEWRPAIEQAMASCQVALMLVSTDFLNSRFIREEEIPTLLRRRKEEGIRVIPVILSPCAWEEVAQLQGLQARPKDGRSLSSMDKHDAEAAIVQLVKETAKPLPTNPPPPPPPIIPPPGHTLRKLAYGLPAAAVALLAAGWGLGLLEKDAAPKPPDRAAYEAVEASADFRRWWGQGEGEPPASFPRWRELGLQLTRQGDLRAAIEQAAYERQAGDARPEAVPYLRSHRENLRELAGNGPPEWREAAREALEALDGPGGAGR